MSGAPGGERIVAFYGDDFTGSTDSMEAMALAGVPAVLFLEPPDEAAMARFPDARAIGVAGVSRSRSPEWMDATLPGVFAALGALGARFVHYKTCSTFDSSPRIGSIGRALDIGARVFPGGPVPMLVGAPILRRYQAFGNLFATVDGVGYRLDRHPTMSRHPTTPMHEADLRAHLAEQSAARVALMDFLALRSEDPAAHLARLVESGPDAVLFDVLDEGDVGTVGRLVWEDSREPNRFVVGSSGFEYALIAHLRASGVLEAREDPVDAVPVDRIFAISGSASPATAAQIQHALAQGYQGIELDVSALTDGARREQAIGAVVERAVTALTAGRSVIAFSTVGAPTGAARELQGAARESFSERLGRAQGVILRETLAATDLRRAIVAGGDTSSYACRELGITALTTHTPIAPGTPICLAHAPDGAFDGLEIALKGGQVGGERFFEQVRLGEARTLSG